MAKTTTKTSSKTTGRQPPSREGPTDPHRLGAMFLRARDALFSWTWRLRFWRDEFWEWRGTHYRLLKDGDLRAQLTAAIKVEFDRLDQASQRRQDDADSDKDNQEKRTTLKVNRSQISNVIQALEGMTLVPADLEMPAWLGPSLNGQPSYVAMQNGLVDLNALLRGETKVLRPHSPDWFSPVCLPYAYAPAARCPRLAAFLKQVFEGDSERIAFFQEWVGYLLTSDTSHEKFVIAVGEGDNGKSVAFEVVTALLGEDNVSHVPLELFGQRFQLGSTIGKLANIVSEIGEGKTAEGLLKQYVSGEPVHIDRKNKSPLDVPPTARLMFSTNTLPRFRDRSRGIWRRVIPLPFRVVIPVNQQDRELADKLKAELPGIFNWVVEGLRRLRTQGRFTDPKVCRAALSEHQLDSNPAQRFLNEYFVRRPGASLACSYLRQQYRSWCEEEGYHALDDREFGKEVARLFPGVIRKHGVAPSRGAKRPWVYDGIQLQDNQRAAGAPIASVRPVAKSK